MALSRFEAIVDLSRRRLCCLIGLALFPKHPQGLERCGPGALLSRDGYGQGQAQSRGNAHIDHMLPQFSRPSDPAHSGDHDSL
jgi:hypothetical protein